MSKTSAVVHVVDDDESVRRALGSLVRSAGLRVQTFPSAQEFLAFPRPDVFDKRKNIPSKFANKRIVLRFNVSLKAV